MLWFGRFEYSNAFVMFHAVYLCLVSFCNFIDVCACYCSIISILSIVHVIGNIDPNVSNSFAHEITSVRSCDWDACQCVASVPLSSLATHRSRPVHEHIATGSLRCEMVGSALT